MLLDGLDGWEDAVAFDPDPWLPFLELIGPVGGDLCRTEALVASKDRKIVQYKVPNLDHDVPSIKSI